jgi:hypothetical protein
MAKKGKAKATTRKNVSQTRSQPNRQATAKSRSQESSSRRSATPNDQPVIMPFTRMNYLLMIGGVAIIALGFILMSFDPFIDATEFSISLYVAPPIVIFGFMSIIYAIMYKDPSKKEPVEGTAAPEG